MLVVLVLSNDVFKRRDLNSNCLGIEWFRMRQQATRRVASVRALSLSLPVLGPLFLLLTWARADLSIVAYQASQAWMNDSLIRPNVFNAFRWSPQVVNKQLRADYEKSQTESTACLSACLQLIGVARAKQRGAVLWQALRFCGYRPPTENQLNIWHTFQIN